MATGTNTNNEDFAVGSVGDDATHWTMWDAPNAGNLKWVSAVSGNPAALAANEFYRLQPGDISISVPEGTDGATGSGAADGVRGIMGLANSGIGRYYQLHDGAPGGNGTNNVLTTRKLIGAISVTE